MDGYTGEIRIFANTFAPMDWAMCNGQALSVRAYPRLFAIIGTTYGGDGTNSFNLPNLQGQLPIGVGTGPGLTERKLGSTSQQNSYIITDGTMPPHTHTLNGTLSVVSDASPANAYTGSYLNSRTAKNKYVSGSTPTGSLDANTLSTVGFNGNPVSVMQPTLSLCFGICINGEYPTKS
jgi:microcystin-dependent protein